MNFLLYKKTYSKLGSTFMMIIRCIVLIFAFSIFTVVNTSESVFAFDYYDYEELDTEFSDKLSSTFKGRYQKNDVSAAMRYDSSYYLHFSAAGGVYEGFINTYEYQDDFHFNLEDNNMKLEYEVGSGMYASNPYELFQYYNNVLVPFYKEAYTDIYSYVGEILATSNSSVAIVGDDDVTFDVGRSEFFLVSYLDNYEFTTKYTYIVGELSNISFISPIAFVTFGYYGFDYLLILIAADYCDEVVSNSRLDEGVNFDINSISVVSDDTISVTTEMLNDYINGCIIEISGDNFTTLSLEKTYYDCYGEQTYTFTSSEFVAGASYDVRLNASALGVSYTIDRSFVFEYNVEEYNVECDFENIVQFNSYTACYENDDDAYEATMQIVSSNNDIMEIQLNSGGRIYNAISNDMTNYSELQLSLYEPDLKEALELDSDALDSLLEKYDLLHSGSDYLLEDNSNNVTFVIATFSQFYEPSKLVFLPYVYDEEVKEVSYYVSYFVDTGEEYLFNCYTNTSYTGEETELTPDQGVRVMFIKYDTGVTEHMVIIINKTPGNDSICQGCGNVEITNLEYTSDGLQFDLDTGINDSDMSCQISIDMTPLKYVGYDSSECNTNIYLSYDSFFDGAGIYDGYVDDTYYLSILVVDVNNVYIYDDDYLLEATFGFESDVDLCNGYNYIGAAKGDWSACYMNNNSQSVAFFGDITSTNMVVSMNGRIYGGVAGVDAAIVHSDTSSIEYHIPVDIGIEDLINTYNNIASLAWAPLSSDYPDYYKLGVVFARYSELTINYATDVVYYDSDTSSYAEYSGYYDGFPLTYSPIYMAGSWYYASMDVDDDGTLEENILCYSLIIIVDIENFKDDFHPQFEVENLTYDGYNVNFDLVANEEINYDYIYYSAEIKDTSCSTNSQGYNFGINLSISCTLEQGVFYTLSVNVTDYFGMYKTKDYTSLPTIPIIYDISQPTISSGSFDVLIEFDANSMDGKYVYYLLSEVKLTSYNLENIDSISLNHTFLSTIFSYALISGSNATITLPTEYASYYIYVLTYIDHIDIQETTYFVEEESDISGTITNDSEVVLNWELRESDKLYTQFASIINNELNGDSIEFTLSDGYPPSNVRYILSDVSGASFAATDVAGLDIWFDENALTTSVTDNKFFVPLTSGYRYIYILTHQTYSYHPDTIFAQQGLTPTPTYILDYSNSSPHTIEFVDDYAMFSQTVLYFQEFGPYNEKTAPEEIVFDVQNANGNGKLWTGFDDTIYMNPDGLTITYKFEDISYPINVKFIIYGDGDIPIVETSAVSESSVLEGTRVFAPTWAEIQNESTVYLKYQVWDAYMNEYVSEKINIILDAEAPSISLDPNSIVTELTTTVGTTLQAYIIGDNYDYDAINTFYYNSPLSYVPYLHLYNYEEYSYIASGGSYGSINASSFTNYYLHVALDNPYDWAGNKIIGPECGSLHYCFDISSSDGILGSVSVSDPDENTWDDSSSRAIVNDGFKFTLSKFSSSLTHTPEFRIYDLDNNVIVWSSTDYTYSDNEITHTSIFEGTITDSGELCLLIYLNTGSDSHLDTMLIVAIDIDATAPTLSLSDTEVVTEITVNADEEINIVLLDDVDKKSLLSGEIEPNYLYYYASLYDALPKYTFTQFASDVYASNHCALNYSKYYLFVGIKQFTDTVGNEFTGDHLVCSDSTQCDFGYEGVVFKFIINVSDAAISNIGLTAQGSSGYIDEDEERTIYTTGEMAVSTTTNSNAEQYSNVSVIAGLMNEDFSETDNTIGFTITGANTNSEVMIFEDYEVDMGIYYIHVNISIYSSDTNVEFTMNFYARIYYDNEGPILSLSPDEDLFEVEGVAGEEINFYYREDQTLDEEPILKYFVSVNKYSGVHKLPIEKFRDVKPIIMNTPIYYLYVLTRGYDLAGNLLSNDGIKYIGDGVTTNQYTDGTYVVIEFVVKCSTVNDSIDMIRGSSDVTPWGGVIFYLRDFSQSYPDMVVASINDCSSAECSAKDILEHILNDGVSIGEIYQSVSTNTMGMETSLDSTAIFTSNNGNLYIPGIVMYSSDNTRSQIVDLMILSYVPVISGSSNSGSSLTVNKGEEIGTNIGLAFKSVDGSKVNVDTLITFNGEKVKSIDTSKVGTYTVTQIATDALGRKNKVVREIIVLENEMITTNVDIVEVIEEPEEIIALPQSVNTVTETNTVKEEIRLEIERVELHIESKIKFKGYSKKKMIKKNKKEQFNFKLFSKYFFKVYDG